MNRLRNFLAKIPYGSEPVLRWIFACLILTLALVIALAIIGPRDIVSLEIAGTAPAAAKVIEGYGCCAAHLPVQLGLDYPLAVAYSTMLALCCWRAARFAKALNWHRTAMAGRILAPCQWLAGLLDWTENSALLGFYYHQQNTALPAVSMWCAYLKFALAGLGGAYAAVLLWRTAPPARRAEDHLFAWACALFAVFCFWAVRSAMDLQPASRESVRTNRADRPQWETVTSRVHPPAWQQSTLGAVLTGGRDGCNRSSPLAIVAQSGSFRSYVI